MVKKTTSGRDPHKRVLGKVETVSDETHQQVFARLAKIKQGEIHGAPGPRKPRKQK